MDRESTSPEKIPQWVDRFTDHINRGELSYVPEDSQVVSLEVEQLYSYLSPLHFSSTRNPTLWDSSLLLQDGDAMIHELHKLRTSGAGINYTGQSKYTYINQKLDRLWVLPFLQSNINFLPDNIHIDVPNIRLIAIKNLCHLLQRRSLCLGIEKVHGRQFNK